VTPIVTSVFSARCICGEIRTLELDIADPWEWTKIHDRLRAEGWSREPGPRGRRLCPHCAAEGARTLEPVDATPAP
jgi:hypothetical protein